MWLFTHTNKQYTHTLVFVRAESERVCVCLHTQTNNTHTHWCSYELRVRECVVVYTHKQTIHTHNTVPCLALAPKRAPRHYGATALCSTTLLHHHYGATAPTWLHCRRHAPMSRSIHAQHDGSALNPPTAISRMAGASDSSALPRRVPRVKCKGKNTKSVRCFRPGS